MPALKKKREAVWSYNSISHSKLTTNTLFLFHAVQGVSHTGTQCGSSDYLAIYCSSLCPLKYLISSFTKFMQSIQLLTYRLHGTHTCFLTLTRKSHSKIFFPVERVKKKWHEKIKKKIKIKGHSVRGDRVSASKSKVKVEFIYPPSLSYIFN